MYRENDIKDMGFDPIMIEILKNVDPPRIQTRVVNCLFNMRILSFVKFTETDLGRIPEMGKKSLRALLSGAASVGRPHPSRWYTHVYEQPLAS